MSLYSEAVKIKKVWEGDSQVWTIHLGGKRLHRFYLEEVRAGSGKLRGWDLTDTFLRTSKFFANRNQVRDHVMDSLIGSISEKQYEQCKKEVKMLLHAHRDCLRNKGEDTHRTAFNMTDGYYGEAFGIMRCLNNLGLFPLGPSNKEWTLQSEMRKLEQEVLTEENWRGTGECDHCLERYGKDDAGRKRV